MFSRSKITCITLIIFFAFCYLNAVIKAMWVTPWDMNTTARIDNVINRSIEWGITDLLVEVRYRADAMYIPNRTDSTFPNPEVRAYLLRDEPNLDALQMFIDKTRHTNIRIHAWVTVNVITPRVENLIARNHLYRTHPHWLTVNSSGKVVNFSQFEGAFLDPGIPEVQTYLTNVFSDIVKNYDIAGLHLDYIRYPASNYGYNRVSVQRFEAQRATGIQHFNDWKQQQIYDLVKKIGISIKGINPNIEYTAAVIANYARAINDYSQGWHTWLEDGIIDQVYIMAYSARNSDFENTLNRIPERLRNDVVVGVRAWSDDGSYRIQSLREKFPLIHPEFAGICFFSFGGIIAQGYQAAVKESGFRTVASAHRRPRTEQPTIVDQTPMLPEIPSPPVITTPPPLPPLPPPPPIVEPPMTEPQPPPITPPTPPVAPRTTNSVAGFVYGFNQQPLKGARVVNDNNSEHFTFTDDNGYFILNLSNTSDRSFTSHYMNFSQTQQITNGMPLQFNLSVFPTQIFNFKFSGSNTERGIFLYWDRANDTGFTLFRKSLAFDDNFTRIAVLDGRTNYFYDQNVDKSEHYEYQLIRHINQSSFIYRSPLDNNDFPWMFDVFYHQPNIQIEIINKAFLHGHWFMYDLASNVLANGFLDQPSFTQTLPISHLSNRFLIIHYTIENKLYNYVIDLMDLRER